MVEGRCWLAHSVSTGPRREGKCQGALPPPWHQSDLDFSFHRSFEPILRLLPQGISPVSQHWATWALYNLVSVYREYPLALVLTVPNGGNTGSSCHTEPLQAHRNAAFSALTPGASRLLAGGTCGKAMVPNLADPQRHLAAFCYKLTNTGAWTC